MTKLPALEELSVVIAASNHSHSGLSIKALQDNGIIPGDWQLLRPAILSEQKSELLFNSGVRIQAHSGMVSISEGVKSDGTDPFQLVEVARKYAKSQPDLNIQAVGINPRRFVPFQTLWAARRFLKQRVLKPGDWQTFRNSEAQASLTLTYPFKHGKLRLAIDEAWLDVGEKELPTLLFSGNFHHDVKGDSHGDRLQDIEQFIDAFEENLEAYRMLLDRHLLQGLHMSQMSVSSRREELAA